MWSESSARTRSVAVLPFVSLTDAATIDAEGVIMAMNLATLFRADPWRVFASPVESHVASPDDMHVQQWGRWLNADLVLIGHVRRRGDSIETCFQLIDTVSGFTRWRGRCAGCAGAARPESAIAVQIAGEVRQALAGEGKMDG